MNVSTGSSSLEGKMDSTSPHKTKDKGVLKESVATSPKPSVVSPIKQFGKVSLGFRGFKLINPKIKFVKQVDVKTLPLKQPASATSSGNNLQTPQASKTSHAAKLSTADALKQIRERIQQRKKQQEELFANDTSENSVSEDASEVKSVVAPNVPDKLHNASSKDDSKELIKSPKKDADAKLTKHSTINTKDVHSGSSSHGHSHRHEQRKPRERSKSPLKSPHRDRHSNRERMSTSRRKSSSNYSRTEEYKHRDNHNHRYSPPRPRKNRSRSREDSRSYRHSHHSNHQEKRKSWDLEARHAKRVAARTVRVTKHTRSRRTSQHHKQSPKRISSHSSESKKSVNRSTSERRTKVDSEQQSENTKKQTSLVESELSASDFEGPSSHKSEEGSEYIIRSGCSSLGEGESDTILCTDPGTKPHEERDGLFSKLSEFTHTDGMESESTEEEIGNTLHSHEKKIKMEVDLMTTPSLSLVAKLYSDDDDSSNAEDASDSLHPGRDTASCEVPTYYSDMEEAKPTSPVCQHDSQTPDTSDPRPVLTTNQSASVPLSPERDIVTRLELNRPPSSAICPRIPSFINDTVPDNGIALYSSAGAVSERLGSHDAPLPIPDSALPINHLVATPCITHGTTPYPIQPSVADEDPRFSSCSSTSTPLLDEPPTPPYSPLSTVLQDDEDDRSWRDPSPIRTEVDSDLPPPHEEKRDDLSFPALAARPRDFGWQGPGFVQTEIDDYQPPHEEEMYHSKIPVQISHPEDVVWEESRSIRTEVDSDYQPHEEKKGNSKIPVLASHLKNVFESLLQTDFTGANAQEPIAVPKINGLIPVLTEAASPASAAQPGDDAESPISLARDMASDGDTQKQPDEKDSKTKEAATPPAVIGASVDPPVADIMEEKPASPQPALSVKSNVVEPLASVVATPDPTTRTPHASPSRTNSVSPCRASSISPCSNKLKLHATTKTPLPAKKSYVQQVQIDNEIQLFAQEDNQTHSTSSDAIRNDSVKTVLPEPQTSVPTIAECSVHAANEMFPPVQIKAEADVSTAYVVAGQSEVVTNIKEEDNNVLVEQVHSDLPRQDSSGSSHTEADDDTGPRRSARIKTKKEKTKSTRPKLNTAVSEPGSCEPTPPIDSSGSEIKFASSDNSFGGKVADQEEIANKRIPEELSELDQFKADIHLAEGTEDAPDKFVVLEDNLYLTAKKKSRARKEIRRMVCECALDESPQDGACCGENCLNRLLMIECSSRCEFGDRCTNKRFQHKIYAPTEVFKTDFKGWGIRAAANMRADELVMEYCGEVVDQREFVRRSLEYSQSNHAHFYFMALSQDEVIDATYKGNSSRFINHSCDPNAETQKWTVNGRLRVGFFTLRDIPKGEEITFDYQFERYGKVAQKCYCGAAKCRGYLGRAPDEDDKKSKLSKKWSSQDLSNDIPEDGSDLIGFNEKEKKKNKKKLALFEDDAMEKDISKLLGGLRSSKEVLALSRLMVRCDTHSQRVMCLQVLKETTSQTRLKTFLQFHGLSIIWSWMVEITAAEDSNAHLLKMDIIETLCKLPITNKNIIEDSKVLSVVQRWAKNGTDDKSPVDDGETVADKKDETPNTSPKDENVQDTCVEDSTTAPENKNKDEETSKAIVSTVEDSGEIAEVAKEASSDEDSKDGDKKTGTAIDETNRNLLTAAASLLDSWKDLREIYRIPKRQKPATSPEHDSSSRDNSHSRTSSPLPKHSRNDESEYRGGWHGQSNRGESQERWREDHNWENDRNWHREKRSDRRDSRLSPGSYGNEGKWESATRKRRFSADSDEQSLNGKNVPWHCRPPQNSRFETKMSRQEHRRRFEKDMQKREEQKKRRVGEQQDMTPLLPLPHLPTNNTQTGPDIPMSVQNMSMLTQDMLMMGQDMQMVGQVMPANEPTFTSSGYSGNLIQINPSPQPQIIMQPYVEQGVNQHMGAVTQMMAVVQQPQNTFSMQMPVQHDYSMPGMYTQDPTMQVSYNITNQNLQGQHQLGSVGPQILTNHPIGLQQQPVLQQPVVQPPQPQPQQPSSNLTILGSQNGQAIVLLTAEQLKKLTQEQAPVTQQSQAPVAQVKQSMITNSEKTPKKIKSKKSAASSTANDPKSTTPTKLPPNWKIASDPEGRIYYYHGITRQTQWDPPTWGGKEEDMVGKKEAEMDLSSTPTYDERPKSSKHKGEKITEEGKKAKETFRLKMSQFVVHCLSSFRKADCKVGRITSTEDFKHLARKLTHNLMLKEIKQVRVWEDLDFNANVRHKTKEYVKKYMNRVGPIYRIRDDNPMDPS